MLKQRYWQMRERAALAWSAATRDPPYLRISRFVHTHLRRTIDLNGIRIRLHPSMGMGLAVGYMLDGRYERPERKILEYALTSQDRVLELGTGIGYLSALCAKAIGSDKVFTFEANRMLRPMIDETYAMNGVQPHVEFCMLGEHEGVASLNVNADFWASAQTERRGTTNVISVPVKPLNDVLRLHEPTFLIIDIEGGERDLVRYMSLEAVDKVCIELHPWQIGKDGEQSVRQFFIENGFREVPQVSDEEHVLYVRSTRH